MLQLLNTVRTVLVRDLRAIERELAAYPDDDAPWKAAPGIANSAGTLTLHAAGNLQYFIGALLGNTGYVRDRNAEFSLRGVPRAELQKEIDAAVAAVEQTLPRLTPGELSAEYPIAILDRRVRTGDFLVHLCTHLSYHLGQIDYHRRMLVAGAGAIETISPKVLREI